MVVPKDSRYLSVCEVAQLLGVHESTVKRWIHRGWLPAVRFGPAGTWRVDRHALSRQIAAIRMKIAKNLRDSVANARQASARARLKARVERDLQEQQKALANRRSPRGES